MNDEDSFQAFLDANPTDQVARGAFGDWLTDRGDVRGPGYCELARRGKYPDQRGPFYLFFGIHGLDAANPHHLPYTWFSLIDARASGGFNRWDHSENRSRRASEDAAALAFARM